uniref:Tudor domain-containing protein n=1 Tax=Caenorhabditis tropicalis TaxID=1561998 RepID=A0A1I7TQI1_9PELO
MAGKLNPYRKYYPEYVNPNAIRRIHLKDAAMVELLRVESPSSMFVRPKDHIRDQLIVREPFKMTPITDIREGVFALAPLDDRVFGRCVIVKNRELLELCRVFFIDEAITANVSWKCLFQIAEKDLCHPWQAMHITLGRITSLTLRYLSSCACYQKVVN